MINEVSKPLSYHVPVEKVCEKLKKKDSQICELKYGKKETNILHTSKTGSVRQPISSIVRFCYKQTACLLAH